MTLAIVRVVFLRFSPLFCQLQVFLMMLQRCVHIPQVYQSISNAAVQAAQYLFPIRYFFLWPPFYHRQDILCFLETHRRISSCHFWEHTHVKNSTDPVVTCTLAPLAKMLETCVDFIEALQQKPRRIRGCTGTGSLTFWLHLLSVFLLRADRFLLDQ